MLLLYFLLWTAVAANKPLYKKIGDKAVLTPDSVVNPITSIEWKHGPDLAMERYGNETSAYRHFKDRGSLNISNGALTITGLTPDDSGSYTVEINNEVTSKTQLLVISPVSKPTVSLWCEPEMTYCVLTCNGNTTGVELVTYWWTSGADTWSSTKEHNITKEDNELWFSCAFKNPVSFNSSEIVFNPFKEKEPLYVEIGDKAELTADSEEYPITSIVWKHGPDLAMEWYGNETFSYRQFKDRGLLDTSNGELTITGLTPDDSGNYTVEINNILSSKTQLLVISPVSKPTLSEWCTGTYCVFTCNGNTTGAEPVTYWWTSGDTTWSSTKEHKITMGEKELWFSWFSCAFENPVSNIGSEEVFNPFIRNQLIFMAILLLVVCIIIITFRHKGIINFSRKWINELLKWTFIYILVCILVVFNITLIFNSNFEGIQELLTRMFIMIAVFGVILVGFIIFFIYFLYKLGAYFATNLKWMIIFIAVLFLDMFNIIINLIYEGRTEDLTWMYILIAVFGVILVGFIIAIYFTFKSGKLYLIWRVIYMMPCMSGLFNIIILMYRAINGALIWMIILTAIFGVILVGFIIAIIYLIYKNTNRELRYTFILIAVCIPAVFNIINSLYRAIRGDLTWMIIVSAIFGVIMVGFIIVIIIMYFRYKDKLYDLIEVLILTAVCISSVCNIIINLIYAGRTGDLTWMFNLIPVCMLVGFIIIIIYLIYKGITFFRRKRREREAAERHLQEYLEWKRKGETDETRWQEYLERLDTGEAKERKLQEYQKWKEKGEAAEKKWQEHLEWRRKKHLEWLDKGEAVEKSWQDRLDMGEAAERTWQEFLERRRNGEATETRWKEYLERFDTEHLEWRRQGETNERRRQEYLERLDKGHLKWRRKGDDERRWKEFLKRRDLGANERNWQVHLKWRRKGENKESEWQEYLERLDKEFKERRDEGEAAERRRQEYLQWKKKGEAAERRWQEYLERLDEGEDKEKKWKEYQEWKKKGEAAERIWQEHLEWRRQEYLEWLDWGEAAERSWQVFPERWNMGEAAERKWQEFLERKDTGEAAERSWQEFLESFDTEFQEMLEEGEAAERRRQEYLERLDKGHLKWRKKQTAERRWQVFLERKNVGEDDEGAWQGYLEWRREGEAAERSWQECLERLDEEMSKMLPPVQNTSTQDLTSVVFQDTSNGTEMLEMLPLKKTSTQDTTSTLPPETSKETEKSAIIPDVPETCRLLIDEQTADPEDETQS